VVNEEPKDLELALAAELQAALLPTTCPSHCAHQEAAARNRMCGGVGGDFYDFLHINDDQIAVVIGDVVGHGVRASLLMAKLMGYLRSAPPSRSRPSELIDDLNRMLLDLGNRLGQVVLCSLFYTVIDLPTGVAFFVNAGHPLPVLCDRRTCRVRHLGGQNILLGVEEFKPIEGCHTFTAGERLILHTDGLTDADNGRGQYFGDDRLQQCIMQGLGLKPDDCVATIFADVDAFRNGAKQQDDQTIVIIDRIE
jgi:sigma-B regulation protein RsbU (phosphoserine phosphatase)